MIDVYLADPSLELSLPQLEAQSELSSLQVEEHLVCAAAWGEVVKVVCVCQGSLG